MFNGDFPLGMSSVSQVLQGTVQNRPTSIFSNKTCVARGVLVGAFQQFSAVPSNLEVWTYSAIKCLSWDLPTPRVLFQLLPAYGRTIRGKQTNTNLCSCCGTSNFCKKLLRQTVQGQTDRAAEEPNAWGGVRSCALWLLFAAAVLQEPGAPVCCPGTHSTTAAAGEGCERGS